VQRLLSLFTQGLSGHYLHLRPTDSLTGSFRPDGVTTDGTAIYLPARVEQFDTARHNLGVYRISVLHQLGFYENGSFEFSMATARDCLEGLPAETAGALDRPTDLERFFGLWGAPALMRRIFMTLEDLRIDEAMRTRYPGALADLDRVLAHALAGRPDADTLAAQANRVNALFECLVQFTLGAPRQALLAADRSGQLGPMLDAAQRLRHADASVYDSARAAMRCLQALARAVHDERLIDVEDVKTLSENAADGPPGHGPPGDNAADDDFALDDADFDGEPVDFRGEVRPELVQRQLRAGHTGSLLDALAPRRGRQVERSRQGAGPPRARAAGRSRAAAACLRRTRGRSAQLSLRRMGLSPPGIYLKGWCRLFEHRLRGDDFGFIEGVRQRHAELASQVKRQFKFIKPESYQRVRRVSDGEELELDGIIEAMIDRRAGHATDEHVYRRRDRALREVAAVFLLDMSASTDFPVPDPKAPPPPPKPAPPPDGEFVYAFWNDVEEAEEPGPKRRVIDVAKESLALMSEALETLGDAFAIYGFSGYGRQDVEFHVAKEFNERLSSRSWAAMAAMQPRRSTRMGPAIRHALAKLDREGARMKVLIVVSDGYPQDCDYGPDRNDDEYGIQDTAAALREAERKGVQTFCVTIDPAGYDYLRRMCPDERYLVIDEVADLPKALSKVYRALTA
jgi:hypothetical protein